MIMLRVSTWDLHGTTLTTPAGTPALSHMAAWFLLLIIGSLVLFFLAAWFYFFLCSLVLFLFGSLAFFWQPGFCHDDEIQVHWERIKYRPGQGWWRVCPPRAWPHKYSQRQGLQQPVWIEIPEIQKKQIHNYNFKYKRTMKRTIINTQV